MGTFGESQVVEIDAPVRFGPFSLAGPAGPLFRNRFEVPLRHKTLRVLWMLVAHSGQSVSKQQMVDTIWPDSVVTESSLSVCIREIRKALDDDPRAPLYIQTVHRYGYRFIGCDLAPSGISAKPLFIGRQAEIDLLQSEFTNVLAAAPRLVLVSGEGGIGKSSLIETWCSNIATTANARIIVGRCLDYTVDSEAYLPFLDALSTLSQGKDSDAISSIMLRLAPSWLAQLPAMISDDQLESLSSRANDTGPGQMRRELADLLFELSSDRPLVLVLEDVHWCDAPSAAALAYLAQTKSKGQLLIIASYRGGDIQNTKRELSRILFEFKTREQCAEIKLASLSKAEVSQYLKLKLQDSYDETDASNFYDRVGGHPLFMVTLANQLMLGGSLHQGSVPDDTLSENLRAFIQIRLGDLDARLRQLLEVASVAGCEFTSAEITGLIDGAEDQLAIENLCESLCHQGEFIGETSVKTWPDGTLTGCYTFRHTFLVDVIKGTLSNVRRARLHQNIGERLERGYQDKTPSIAALLAQHFELANDTPRAVKYLLMAAERCVARHAHVEAVELLKRGLTQIGNIDCETTSIALELELLLALGPMQVTIEGYGADSVEETFVRARRLCTSESMASHRLVVLRGLAAFHQLRADYKTAHELGAEIVTLSSDDDRFDDSYLVEGHLICGMVAFFHGQLNSARSELEQSIKLYDQDRYVAHAQIHGIDPGVLALGFHSLTSWILGQPDDALEGARSALALAQSVDHPFSLCQTYALTALLHQFRHDMPNTRYYSDLAAELAQHHHFPYLIASEKARRGWLNMHSGSGPDAIEAIRDGIAHYRNTGAVSGLTILLSTLAEAYLLANDYQSGLDTIEEALSLAKQNNERICVPELLCIQGELLLFDSDNCARDRAYQLIDKARCLARDTQLKSQEIRATEKLSELFSNQGRGEAVNRRLASVPQD
jgi:DNA-binding winged helix-turn-helix (wHTH) protein/ATP/maltotriose-dependent transcriptional regulator MalT